MLRLAFLAAAVSLSACSGSAPAETPGAALPSVPADADVVAVAQPVAPTGDDRLDAFLADLAAAIDRHDWRGVAMYTAPEPLEIVFRTAQASGDSPRDAAARGVARMLGLRDIAAGADPFARLDAVRVVTLRTVGAMNDLPGVQYVVEGDLRLDSGETLPMAFQVGALGDGYGVVLPTASGTPR